MTISSRQLGPYPVTSSPISSPRGELHTNSHGHLGSEKPALAKVVPDLFPNIDSLLSYTNPMISAMDTGVCCTHTPPRWEHKLDLGKLTHLCKLHFKWGLKDIIIKCFHTIVWPGIILRVLRHSALEGNCCARIAWQEKASLRRIQGTIRSHHEDTWFADACLHGQHFGVLP